MDPVARALAARALAPAELLQAGVAADHILNFSGAPLARALPKTRAGLAGVKAGLGPLRIGFGPADSTTLGVGATQATGLVAQAASQLKASGLPVTTASVWGDGSLGQSGFTSFDARVSMGSGWGFSFVALGGNQFNNTTTTNALTFAPVEAIKSVDVWYVNAGGSFTAQIGATSQTVTPTSAFTLSKVTLVASSETVQSVTITRVSGNIIIFGLDAYASAPAIRLWNWGQSGSATATWLAGNSAWNFMGAAASTVSPDLIGIDLGINDGLNSVSAATFGTNLQSLVSEAVASGADVLLCVPVPTATGSISAAAQLAIAAQIIAVAAANRLVVVHQAQRWGSFAISNGLGLYSDSITHPNATGYAEKAAGGIVRLLRSL